MPKAIWNNTVVAEADEGAVQRFDNNVYFPPAAIKKEYFRPSDTTSVCPWKGTASYYTLDVDGATNPDAVWYYPNPKPDAAVIKDHVAFWKGVVVE